MRSAALRLLLPAECLVCHGLLTDREADRIVCGVCRHRWRPVRPPWCERCGQPEPHFGPCRLCTAWPAALRAVRSAVWLGDGARQAVHALKYGGLPRIADDLAAAMAHLAPPTDDPLVLVPIPLAPKRQRARGYNQSEALATALRRQWGERASVRPDLLRRARETATQTTLTPETRLANVAGAFAMRNAECRMRNDPGSVNSALRIPNSGLVLVDDVFTTGATLAEAARALEVAGARIVVGVTFGRAVIPDFT